MSDQDQPALLQISNEIVHLYKEQLGRGPTKVRTDWLGRDALVCTLEDSLTPAERSLRDPGREGAPSRRPAALPGRSGEADFTGGCRAAHGQEGPRVHQRDGHANRRGRRVFYFEPLPA